jgi:phenylalanyl-tRNA synthetase alpha chain
MDIYKIIRELSQNEKKVLITLDALGGSADPKEVLQKGDFSHEVEVMNAASWLQSKKLVNLEEQIHTVYALDKEGELYLKEGLPEKRALQYITRHHGSAPISQLHQILSPAHIPIAIGWLKQKGWATIEKKENVTTLVAVEAGSEIISKEDEDEIILRHLSQHPNTTVEKEKIRPLLSRKNVIKEKEIISASITLTPLGRQILKEGITFEEEISQITSQIIKNEGWRTKTIRAYDVHAFAPKIAGGKSHPLTQLIQRIRLMFLEMGFEEISGDFVESTFWNMDALFIPQDHPARDMHDTLYCAIPAELPIAEQQLHETVAAIHEHGGETSSKGWNYQFSMDEGRRALLRTHTTINTIRYLYHHPNPPVKIFSIGQVFRKENIDATHLPMFYQIEGIVHEEKATFRQLIGLLSEIYKRMGFEKIRFRPGYFPYTEPSLEVEVYWNDKWMELGGSGIFRPEVTEPVGISNPVLAWGLGLERLAMLLFDVQDIRDLYISDFDWLRNQPLL